MRRGESQQQVEQIDIPHGHQWQNRAEGILWAIVGYQYPSSMVNEVVKVQQVHLIAR